MTRLVRFLVQVGYNLAFSLFFFATGPFLLYRLWQRGKLLPQFGQRFGLYDPTLRARLQTGCDLWIHAVSVGEVMLARVLIRRLRELRPGLRVVVTTTTATGIQVAETELAGPDTVILYNPMDFFFSVIASFQLIQPRRLILIESEIWPNYLWCARRRGIPVYLVNARLSRRSGDRYRKMRALVRPILAEISLVFAQDPTDVVRLSEAGFAPETIFELGSLKYDVAALEPTREETILQWWTQTRWNGDTPILLGGSTHPGEEEILARGFREMRSRWPTLRLVLAPRHAERGRAVRELCVGMGLRTALRSELALTNGVAVQESARAEPTDPEVLVVNSTGELSALYKRATLAFVGKSLRGNGGQNFLEAAKEGTPTLLGPNMQNFEVVTREFLAQHAVIQVSDEFELVQRIRELLANDKARLELGQRARATFERNLQAAERTARIIVQSLDSSGRNS